MPDTSITADRVLVDVASKSSAAPYSSAAVWADLVWTSGALPVEPDGTVAKDFARQVRAALSNLEESLHAAGACWSSVLKVNGYVADIELLPLLNEVYNAIVIPHGAPARTTVEVSRFRNGVQVEFDAIAVRRTSGGDR
jgi:2-iminobutanoate/2-iminopropanoate deaminase